jgi:GMP synthase-like glutamine amidotransferase
MPRALIIQHIACEGPGRLGHLLNQRGFELDTCHAYAGDVVPTTLAHDLLVVMGGPMGVADVGHVQYPFLSHEIALLKSVLQQNQPMLGICLGAQLLAHAAGAPVYQNILNGIPVLEVGWAPVDFHGVNERPEFRGLQQREVMLHWHGDTFDLPSGATLLASTPQCRHQLFRLQRQFGFQFHPEIDASIVTEWIHLDAAYVAKAHGPSGAAKIASDTERYAAHHRQVGDQLLGNVLNLIGPSAA